jgi:hypothetical protein
MPPLRTADMQGSVIGPESGLLVRSQKPLEAGQQRLKPPSHHSNILISNGWRTDERTEVGVPEQLAA